MDADFWHQRWQLKKIAFHEGETNALLAKHFDKLQLDKNARVFVPLCGKTRDIAWLLAQGYRVSGIELSQQAVEELFSELGVEPAIERVGNLLHFSHHNIDIFAGDIFDLSSDLLGPVDATYDRAALVALPEKMRRQYTEHLTGITNKAQQFLVCFEYDQSQMNGPPFSINALEVKLHYVHSYELSAIETVNVDQGLRNKVPATETVWLLREKPTKTHSVKYK